MKLFLNLCTLIYKEGCTTYNSTQILIRKRYNTKYNQVVHKRGEKKWDRHRVTGSGAYSIQMWNYGSCIGTAARETMAAKGRTREKTAAATVR